MQKSQVFKVLLFILLSVALQSIHATSAAAANLVRATHFSKYMGNKQWKFNIYLPPSYAAGTQRYPVIYFLHGGGGDENQLTYYVTSFVHPYIEQGKVPETIVVFPSAGTVSCFLDSGIIYPDQRFNPDSYIIKELIPHVDSLYRTIKDRKSRAVSGMSMGGYGTFHFAFKYPELFSAGGPFSSGGPYVNGERKFDGYSEAENPHTLAVTNGAILSKQMRMYISVGATENLVDYSQNLANICKAQNIPYVLNIVPGVGHDLNAQMQKMGLLSVQYITEGFKPTSISDPPLSGASLRSKGMVTLQGKTLRISSPSTEFISIELVTLAGKVAGAYHAEGRNASLDLSEYATGNYIVRMRGAFGTLEKRVRVIP